MKNFVGPCCRDVHFKGIGSGVILNLAEIVLADVVPLAERCVIY